MRRWMVSAFLPFAGLTWLAWAQDSADPVRVENVDLKIDPSACMTGQVMRVVLEVRTDRNLNLHQAYTKCRLAYAWNGEVEPGVECQVASTMCTGLTGSGVIQAKCQGTAGGAEFDTANFKCPQAK